MNRRLALSALSVALALVAASLGAAGSAPGEGAPVLHPSNAAIVQGVAHLLENGGGIHDALEAASIALDARASLLGTVLDPSMAPLFDQQRHNLETARALLEVTEDSSIPDGLSKAVALAQIANRHQAGLGADLPLPPLPAHTLPSEAALDVAKAVGVEPMPEEVERVRELDALEPDLRDALTRVLDAFLHFHYAASTTVSWSDGAGLIPLMAARSELLTAAEDLHDTLEAQQGSGNGSPGKCDPVRILFALSIDLTECNSEYPDNLALLIDAGGNDGYLNNAGGNNLVAGSFGYKAAALLDFGGNDRYGDPELPQGRGVNGGGLEGAGFLLDAGGNDRYFAAQTGVNGGGAWGAGFLLDAAGSDVYNGTSGAVNGGGMFGVGFLLDNGGADDLYRARLFGVNGGTMHDGQGFLLDTGGNDFYGYWALGANGGGYSAPGFLFDGGGNDGYVMTATDEDLRRTVMEPGGWGGVNGGAVFNTVGFLLDADGKDRYNAMIMGVNGGSVTRSIGLLVDGDGNDTYEAAGGAVNGGTASGGVGVLVDWGGNDQYLTEWEGAPGTMGVNGGAYVGAALLLDREGDDEYVAGSLGVNGGVAGACDQTPACPEEDGGGVGLLLDGRGKDWYEDNDGGAGMDRTMVPKGILGAQMDMFALT